MKKNALDYHLTAPDPHQITYSGVHDTRSNYMNGNHFEKFQYFSTTWLILVIEWFLVRLRSTVNVVEIFLLEQKTCIWQHQKKKKKKHPHPGSTKRPRLHPPPPHMYERKQSCIKLGDLLPSGQLTPESHFIVFFYAPLSKNLNCDANKSNHHCNSNIKIHRVMVRSYKWEKTRHETETWN